VEDVENVAACQQHQHVLRAPYFNWKLPSAPRMLYFCTAIVSGGLVAMMRSKEARRLRVPAAAGSSGLSGRTSNSPRPMIASRVVWVAASLESVAATMVNLGASGSRTSSTSGEASNRSWKSGWAHGTERG
jgi:hypothetical protein